MATALWRNIRLRSGQPWNSSARWMSTAGPSVADSSKVWDHVTQPSESPIESIDQLHTKLSYLHPSTKPAPEVIRAGDLKTGRIRPTPVYVPLSKHVFGMQPRRDLLHAAVVYYLDGRRKGLASTKTRGEIAFSGAKIRPQKGSGRARLGLRNNPLLRKGGVIHGPKPRDMSSKLNRRVRELALRSAVSAKWNQNQLYIVKSLDWIAPPSTGPLRKLLQAKKWDDCLFLSAPSHPQSSPSSTKPNPKPSASDPVYTAEQKAEHNKSIHWFQVAMNNIPRVELINLHQLANHSLDLSGKAVSPNKPGELHAYSVLKRKVLVCDIGAIEWLEEKLGGSIFHDQELHDLTRDLKEIDEEGAKEDAEREMVAEEIVEEADEILQGITTPKQ